MTPVHSEPYWWDDAGIPACPPMQALPAEADVVVIGAGLTGLSAARTLARRGKHVVVLDAQAPGIGASSRNGGMVGGGHRLSIDEMEAEFGLDTAHGLMREAHLDSTQFAKTLIAEEAIACDFSVSGRFRGFWSDAEYEKQAKNLERLQKIAAVNAHMVPKSRQKEEIASDLYAGGMLLPDHGGLNPAKYVAGLLRAAQAAGALVQGDTPVTGLSRQGGGHVVTSPRGSIRAGAVLAATNGYTPAVLSDEKRRVFAVPSYIVATEPLGENRMRSLIPNGRMIVESRVRHCYYRPSPDGRRLVFGGRAGLVDVSEASAQSQLRGLIAQIFPELKDVALTHSWRGKTGFSFNFLPHVGQHDGVWHAMGFSGNGNTMAPYLGHKAALQMLGDEEGETAFSRTGLPRRWWHRGTPWFMHFADIGFRFTDWCDNLQKRAQQRG